MNDQDFGELLHEKAHELYRHMPWRDDIRPYYVLVSELMLQQTQVSRVIPKFEAFIERFPDVASLSAASLADVLTLWQGLGYNRRAKYLHDSAKMILHDMGGQFPTTYENLQKLPGVGKNTAGAICVYSYNQPVLFIETNIRTVYIHHFFADDFGVDDKRIIEKLQATIDSKNPRKFYWALMDYGTSLKASGVRNNSRSRHYKKQPRLEGSLRQMRGQLIRLLAERTYERVELQKAVNFDDRFGPALDGLVVDGLVSQTKQKLHLTK